MARKIVPQEPCLFCDAFPCTCGQPVAPVPSPRAVPPPPAPSAVGVSVPASPSAPPSAPLVVPAPEPEPEPAPPEPEPQPEPQPPVVVHLPRNTGSEVDEAFEQLLLKTFPGATFLKN